MSGDREDRIRKRAHDLWVAEGHPEGSAQRHWEQAAKEIDAEAAGKPAAKKAAAKPAAAKKPAAPKKAAAPRKPAVKKA